MIDILINVLCVAAIVYLNWRYRRIEQPFRPGKTILLVVTLIFLAGSIGISLSEQISVHLLPTRGHDFVGFYIEHYMLVFFTIPAYWILLKILTHISNSKIRTGTYLFTLIIFLTHFYVIKNSPQCDGEGIMCEHLRLRFGAIAVVGLLFIFFLMEALKMFSTSKSK